MPVTAIDDIYWNPILRGAAVLAMSRARSSKFLIICISDLKAVERSCCARWPFIVNDMGAVLG